MENNASVKDEDNNVVVVPPADLKDLSSVVEKPNADLKDVSSVVEKPNADAENDVQTAVEPVTETKASSTDDQVDDKPPAAVDANVGNSVDKNDSTDSGSAECDKLCEATASVTLSAVDDVDETQEKRVEAVTKEKEVQDGPDASAKPSVAADLDVHSDAPVKQSVAIEESLEEADSGVGGVEDSREFVEEKEDLDTEKQELHVKSQESVPDDEGSGRKESGEDGAEVESKDESKDPAVPVPVDDDTNDPQYIPRRGRFYEHDDRMAYSTTSSECSESDYEDDSDENDEDRPLRRRRTCGKKLKSTASGETVENSSTSVATAEIADNLSSSKKVLSISKVASPVVVNHSNTTSGVMNKPGFGSKKSRDVDSLDKWSHDMYNEHEQAPKSKDELLALYGYDIREESEAPRARRHHKYGRAATTKYTRSWQDTRAYNSNTSGGQDKSNKIKRGLNKNKNKPPTSEEYTSEFPTLDKSKPSESPVVTQNAEPRQQVKSPANEEKKTASVTSTAGPSRLQEPSSRNATKLKTTSPIHNSQSEQQNGGPHLPPHNKNYFTRPSPNYPTDTDKYSQNNQGPTSASSNNFYNRSHKQQNSDHGQHNNYKPSYFTNNQGNPRHQHPSAGPRHRHFQPNNHNNSPQQFNHDRYFSKGSGPNQQLHYDQSRHNNLGSMTAGTGRTQHGQYNRHFENDSGPSVSIQTPIVRSSKRYSVQSRRELPDPVLNFGNIPKTQQQNGLVVQEQPQSTMQQIQPQQMQPSPQVMQQQATIQMHQQQPIQLQQYHQPIQQLHPHHSMVLDHQTGMMVMAAADPSMYHHGLYTAGGNVDDPNTAAAASALQMLATQAAVFQPVPTGVASSANPPQESFMTTYYQPLQQPTQQQPPPRRVNLAIPIVAPPITNQQQNTTKSNTSSSN